MLVVIVRSQFAAIIVCGEELSPIDGVEECGMGEVALDVLLEEPRFELLESPIPK